MHSVKCKLFASISPVKRCALWFLAQSENRCWALAGPPVGNTGVCPRQLLSHFSLQKLTLQDFLSAACRVKYLVDSCSVYKRAHRSIWRQMLCATTSSRLSELKPNTHLEAGVGVVEIGVIAGQVQLDIEVITVYRLVRLSCCAHIQLQQGRSMSVSLHHDPSHSVGCLVAD